MSLTDVIGSLPSTTYAVSRPGAESYDANGRLSVAAPSNFNITGNVQPLRGRELQALPEGFHGMEVKRVSTTTELKLKDTVTIDSESWKVVGVKKHTTFGTHYVAVVARQAVP